MNPIARYTHWLHTMWPAGTVEKLPEVREDGTTAVPGVRVVGDLTGIPLLKFSSDTGARAVQAILAEPDFARGRAGRRRRRSIWPSSARASPAWPRRSRRRRPGCDS